MAVSFSQNWADDVVDEFDRKELDRYQLLTSLLNESQTEEDWDDEERLLALMKSLQAEIDSAAAAHYEMEELGYHDHALVSVGIGIGRGLNCSATTMSPENFDFPWMDIVERDINIDMDIDMNMVATNCNDMSNWYIEYCCGDEILECNGTTVTMAGLQDQSYVSLWQEY